MIQQQRQERQQRKQQRQATALMASSARGKGKRDPERLAVGVTRAVAARGHMPCPCPSSRTASVESSSADDGFSVTTKVAKKHRQRARHLAKKLDTCKFVQYETQSSSGSSADLSPTADDGRPLRAKSYNQEAPKASPQSRNPTVASATLAREQANIGCGSTSVSADESLRRRCERELADRYAGLAAAYSHVHPIGNAPPSKSPHNARTYAGTPPSTTIEHTGRISLATPAIHFTGKGIPNTGKGHGKGTTTTTTTTTTHLIPRRDERTDGHIYDTYDTIRSSVGGATSIAINPAEPCQPAGRHPRRDESLNQALRHSQPNDPRVSGALNQALRNRHPNDPRVRGEETADVGTDTKGRRINARQSDLC